MPYKNHLAGIILATLLAAPGLNLYAADASLSLDKPATGTSVQAGTSFSLTITPSGLGSGISYSTVDTDSDSTISGSNIDASGHFNWTPTINELGLHTLTITARDAAGVSANTSIQFVVALPPTTINIVSLTPGTSATVGATVSFTASTSGFSYPSFTLTDSFAGSSLTSGNINATGNFTWTPGTSDIGTHAINVAAKDFHGATGSTMLTITVNTAAPVVPTPAPTPAPMPMPAQNLASSSPSSGSVLGANTVNFTSTLKLGSKGTEVTALQNILIDQGYLSGEATGHFGSATKAALQKYQSAHGLDPLGIVGPATRTLLNGGGTVLGATTSNPTGPTPTLSSTARASRIAALRLVIAMLQSELDTLVSGQ